MKSMFRKALLFFLVSILAPGSLFAASPKKKSSHDDVYGSFTSVCQHPESSDLLGFNIFVLQGKVGVFLLFQEAQGVLANPLLIEARFTTKDETSIELTPVSVAESPISRLTYKNNSIEIEFANGRIGAHGGRVDVLNRGPFTSPRTAPKCTAS